MRAKVHREVETLLSSSLQSEEEELQPLPPKLKHETFFFLEKKKVQLQKNPNVQKAISALAMYPPCPRLPLLKSIVLKSLIPKKTKKTTFLKKARQSPTQTLIQIPNPDIDVNLRSTLSR